ncbi:MAG: hypothetical protein RI906_2266, partial [Pseudomonadota bacterium]
MLLDGAALATTTRLVSDTETQQTDAIPAVPAPEVEAPAPASAPVDTPTDPAAEAEPVFALSPDPQGQVVVIDASVPFAEQLLADIPADWTVIHLQPDRDGLAQLAQALQSMDGLKAIHLFSHGGEGRVELGATSLTAVNLAEHAALLREIGQHLSATGDLMIYGCNVAEGFMGQQFVNDIARITGADVAASDDATGNVFVGGDWQLEHQAGEVATTPIAGAADYANTLVDYNISINQWSQRLYHQASGFGAGPWWNNTDTTAWADAFTINRTVPYWGTEARSFSYPVPRWGWLPWEMRTVWYTVPVERTASYGVGTRYGTQTVTLQYDSSYEFVLTGLANYKQDIPAGRIQSLGAGDSVGLNVALYQGSFNPNRPLNNLVAASQGTPITTGSAFRWGAGNLYRGELAAGNYTVVVSYDGFKLFPDGNIWWSRANNYAEQVWGDYKLTLTNLNRTPVWSTRSLNSTLTGAGEQRYSIPLSVGSDRTVTDADGDELTITAAQSNGQPLPVWLSFNANSLTFSGNAPANTAPITVRLTAHDGQVSSTKDFVLSFASDNDQPVLALPVADLTWDGSGAFSWAVPGATFTDADPGADVFTYTASLANGNALPSWLSMSSSGTLSGNPPANFASLQIRITANDGSGQANATQTDEMIVNLVNNNDIPTVSSTSKSVDEDSALSFAATDFAFSDTDTHASDGSTSGTGRNLQFIRLVSVPANGTLWVDLDADGVLDAGEALQVNSTVTATNLSKLRYTPTTNWAGASGLDLSSTPDSFSWVGSDGVSESSNVAVTTVTVNLVNDAPTLTFSQGRTLVIRPNTNNALGVVTVDAGLTITDADALYTSNTAFDTITKVTVSVVDKVTGGFVSGDTLAVTNSGGITGSYNSSAGVLTLTGSARAAAYQTVLRTLQFSSTNTSNDNLREISMQLQVADVGSMSFATFDGVNDRIDLMDALLPVGGDFTVSVWAQIDTSVANGNYTILAQGNSSDNFFILYEKTAGGHNIRLGDNWQINNVFPSDGKWHQYTVTRNGTTGTLYIDGVRVGTGTMEAALPGTSTRVGDLYRRNDLQEWGPGVWKGGISDLRIYNRVITPGEITASLDSAAGLRGYEPNLVAWYPLKDNLTNQASGFSWSIGRDFNPLNGDGTDGVWSVGVITGNTATTTGNFNWGPFEAYTQANSDWSVQTDPTGAASDYIRLGHNEAAVGNDRTGWGWFYFPNNFDNANGLTLRPGAVGMIAGMVNPAAMQFTAPVAGVYAVDARFWDAHPDTAPTSPLYKVFKVNVTGTSGVEISPGAVATGENTLPNSASARSAVRQVALAAGERLVFAVHKGAADGLYADEMQATVDINLLAMRVASGHYYSLDDGHYYNSTATAPGTFDAARTLATQQAAVASAPGYLATPSTPAAAQIAGALTQLAKDNGSNTNFSWAALRQTSSTSEPTGNWFWTDGPEAGTPFTGVWASGEPNNGNSGTEHYGSVHVSGGFNDLPFTYADTRALVEFGTTRLPEPTELTNALTSLSNPGNALVFLTPTTAYSTLTGHYYQLTSTAGDFDAQNLAASQTTYGGQTGYLTRATTPEELALVTRLARLQNSSGVWVGLKNIDTNGQGSMDWRWVNAAGTSVGSLDGSSTYQTAESINTLEAAGWTRVARDNFSHGATGWLADSGAYPVRIEEGRLGRYSNEGGGWAIKELDLNNKATVITFDFHRIDTWDAENFIIRFRPDN